MPKYKYKNVPSKDALAPPVPNEEEKLREQLREFQVKEKKDQI